MEQLANILHRIAALPGANVDYGFGQDREAVRRQFELLYDETFSDLSLNGAFTDHQETMDAFYAWIRPELLPDAYRAFIEHYGGFRIQTTNSILVVRGFGPMCYEWYEPIVLEESATEPSQDGLLDIGRLHFEDHHGNMSTIVLGLDLLGSFKQASVLGIGSRHPGKPSIYQISANPSLYHSEWNILANSFLDWLALVEQTSGRLGYLETWSNAFSLVKTSYTSQSLRNAAVQHGIAVDRFAREIVRILKVVGGALAATECQAVGRQPPMPPLWKPQAGIGTNLLLHTTSGAQNTPPIVRQYAKRPSKASG
jgi:hypothetical protein